jgi:hypothetical protein
MTKNLNNIDIHLIVDDVETAKLVLRKVGNVTTTEVICIKTKNQPGAIANLARKCAGAQINIRHVYATSIGKESMVYLAVEDLEKAKKALK